MFELTDIEFRDLRSKFSTTKFSKRRITPKAFTEQGVYMVATILKSQTAIDVTIAIMRAFVKMRNFALTYEQIIDKLKDIDTKDNENRFCTGLRVNNRLLHAFTILHVRVLKIFY